MHNCDEVFSEEQARLALLLGSTEVVAKAVWKKLNSDLTTVMVQCCKDLLQSAMPIDNEPNNAEQEKKAKSAVVDAAHADECLWLGVQGAAGAGNLNAARFHASKMSFDSLQIKLKCRFSGCFAS